MIDVHQNATLSESFEGDRSRVIGNRCNILESEDLYDDFESLCQITIDIVVYYRFFILFLPTLFHVFLVFSPVLPFKNLKKVLHYFSPPRNLSLFLYL